ncbi:MAG: hypothetical protein M0C28_47585 [Candidatus Moduliflexus flocculans]|nr:hypothetical protein [Candidatus Moduliflexus flocculans]
MKHLRNSPSAGPIFTGDGDAGHHHHRPRLAHPPARRPDARDRLPHPQRQRPPTRTPGPRRSRSSSPGRSRRP